MLKFMQRGPDPREISTEDAAAAYEAQEAIFVDVREEDEWAEGHMPDAVLIPLGDLERRVNELPQEGRIIAVCRSGGRSLAAVDMLTRAGFRDAKSMAGGMVEWSKQGRPVE